MLLDSVTRTSPESSRSPKTRSAPTDLRGRQREIGQSLVEFALVLPILLFTFSVMVDLSLAFYSYASLGNAVRQGVRYGAIWTNANNDAGIRDYVAASTASGVNLTNDASHIVVSAVQSATNSTLVASGSRTSGNLLAVEARYDYTSISPALSFLLPNGTIPLVIVAKGIVE